MTENVVFPESWWRERPLVFGHRGASHAAPENTFAAFQKAIDEGADGVELDVLLSSDGVPMVIHDAKVDAVTDGTGYVSSMPRDRLKELDAGSYFDAAFAGERLPTLKEVFAEFGQKLLFNIEMKDVANKSMGVELAVVNTVRLMGMENRVWFSSFKPYMLHQVRRFAPKIPCGLLYSPLSMSSLLLAPITPYEAVHPHARLVTKRLVRRMHRRGMRVVAWTVNEIERAQKLAAWGVDVLITDTPGAILEAISAAPAEDNNEGHGSF